MQHLKSMACLPAPRRAAWRVAAAWRAGLATLAIAGLVPACQAADTLSGLGSAFRPQGGANATAEGNGEPTDPNQSGLRVVVSRPSRSVALIDSKIVQVGDLVNNKRVARINPQEVVLMGEDGVSERLLVSPSVVKRKPAVNATRHSIGVRP